MKTNGNVRSILDEATRLNVVQKENIAVNIFFDDSAPADLQVFLRSSFTSASYRARVSISYLTDEIPQASSETDMAVIVAGFSTHIGRFANELRSQGVPTMIATTMPTLVDQIARESGYAIPDGDIISPLCEEEGMVERFVSLVQDTALAFNYEGMLPGIVEKIGAQVSVGLEIIGSSANMLRYVLFGKPSISGKEELIKNEEALSAPEPIALGSIAQSVLSDAMGRWIFGVYSEKALTFALSFPFVREPYVRNIIKNTSVQNAGVGALFFVPGADMPIMTINQAKMILLIASVYGYEMTADRAKEIACVIGGGFLFRGIARQIAGILPVGGWLAKAGIAYSGTYAIGITATEHFEGNLSINQFEKAGGRILSLSKKIIVPLFGQLVKVYSSSQK